MYNVPLSYSPYVLYIVQTDNLIVLSEDFTMS